MVVLIGLDPAPPEHFTALVDIQSEVAHVAVESAVLAVKSDTPKFNPRTVTDADPEKGAFLNTADATGVSNVIWPMEVPTNEPIVTEMILWMEYTPAFSQTI
jgi:hypothetical protein